MDVTVEIDDEIFTRATAAAEASGRTLSEFVTHTLKKSLATMSPLERRMPFATFKGTGVHPGVDLTNNSALLDLMEEGLELHKRR